MSGENEFVNFTLFMQFESFQDTYERIIFLAEKLRVFEAKNRVLQVTENLFG